eukprot:1147857-Prymnesium_polylepis.1
MHAPWEHASCRTWGRSATMIAATKMMEVVMTKGWVQNMKTALEAPTAQTAAPSSLAARSASEGALAAQKC